MSISGRADRGRRVAPSATLPRSLLAPVVARGEQIWQAHELHCVPLGYRRDLLRPGDPLPVRAATTLAAGLAFAARQVEIAFDGKLGDTLLALSAVRAVLDWLAIQTKPPTGPRPGTQVVLSGPHTSLLVRMLLPETARHGSVIHVATDPTVELRPNRIVVGDRDGLSRVLAASGQSTTTALDDTALGAEARRQPCPVVCAPEASPCWSSGGRAYSDLPARYYLSVERRLGRRLAADASFAVLLQARPNPWVEEIRAQIDDQGWGPGLIVAAIVTTSWPGHKNYGEQRFRATAALLAERLDTPVRLLLIGGRTPGRPAAPQPLPILQRRSCPTGASASAPVIVEARLDGAEAADLADLLPHLSLVIGNDTGLTHLAALARLPGGGGPPVIGLYGRHSHSKWCTGLPHHHAVATSVSQRMHVDDLCPVRDMLAPALNSPDLPGPHPLETITPRLLADTAASVLSLPRTGPGA